MNKLGIIRFKTPTHWLWLSVGLFFLFISIEMNLMALVDGRLYNNIAFPMFRFWSFFGKAWEAGYENAISQFISMTIVQITAVDERSGLKVWALYYHPWNVVAHVLVSILMAKIIVANKVYFNKTTVISFLICVFAIFVPCTYIFLIEHCSGSTWLVETMILATEDGATIDYYEKNIQPVIFVFQILSTLGGLAALYYVLSVAMKKPDSLEASMQNLEPMESKGV